MTSASPEKRLIDLVRQNKLPDNSLARSCDPIVIQFTVGNPFLVNKALCYIHRANGHRLLIQPPHSVDSARTTYRRYRYHIQAGGRAHLFRLAWEARKFVPDEPAPLADCRLWDAYNQVFCESVLFKSVLSRQPLPGGCWVPEVRYQLPAFRDQREANRAYMTAFRTLLPSIGVTMSPEYMFSELGQATKLRIVKEHRREHFLRRFVTGLEQLRKKAFARRFDLRALWEEVGPDFNLSPDILTNYR